MKENDDNYNVLSETGHSNITTNHEHDCIRTKANSSLSITFNMSTSCAWDRGAFFAASVVEGSSARESYCQVILLKGKGLSEKKCFCDETLNCSLLRNVSHLNETVIIEVKFCVGNVTADKVEKVINICIEFTGNFFFSSPKVF